MPEPRSQLRKVLNGLSMGITLWSGLALCTTLAIGKVNATAATEQQIKTAYLYHFTRFVQWPPAAFDSADASFRLCVLGSNPFGEQLQALSKRQHDSHPVTLAYPQSAREVSGCHLLYIATSDAHHEAAILKQYQDTPLLTVSSRPGFAARGGIIGFVMVDERVRLEINRSAARRANIRLSAKLLEVAHVVDKDIDSGEDES